MEPAVPNKVDDIFDEESPSEDLKFLRKLATAEPIHKTIREISTDIKGQPTTTVLSNQTRNITVRIFSKTAAKRSRPP